MIKVLLVDSELEFDDIHQKIISEDNKQIDIRYLLQNLALPYENQRIGLTDGEGTHFFDVRNIIYCINDNSYTHFHIKTDSPAAPIKRLTVSKGLGYWEEFLFEKGYFFRIHNRYMVNINYIKRLHKSENAYLEILNIPGTISVARDKKNEFIKFLKTKRIVL